MNQTLSNFLLKGGRLIDPAGGKDGIFDIRVRNGNIESIGAISQATARKSSMSKITSSHRV